MRPGNISYNQTATNAFSEPKQGLFSFLVIQESYQKPNGIRFQVYVTDDLLTYLVIATGQQSLRIIIHWINRL